MKKFVVSGILAFLFTVALATPSWALAPTADEVASELVCQCGCNSVVPACVHQECTSRNGMMLSIKQQIDAGQSKENIVQGFVARYGEQVLSTPPKKGFNLTAYITPFVALVGGGVMVYLAMKLWVFRGRQPLPTPTIQSTPKQDEAYRRRMEKELAEFKETL